MGIELKLTDVRGIGGMRYGDKYHKRLPLIFWAACLGMVVGVASLNIGCFAYDDNLSPKTISYTNADGQVAMLDLEHSAINVGDVIYLREEVERQGHGAIYGVMLGLLVFGFLLLVVPLFVYIWEIDRFKDKFVQHYVDKKEFIDPD
jgi:hypothetical protein